MKLPRRNSETWGYEYKIPLEKKKKSNSSDGREKMLKECSNSEHSSHKKILNSNAFV